jgi:hypothetical protein
MMQDTQTKIDVTQKKTATEQQQHSCETLICQRHQTKLRFLRSAATASARFQTWRRTALSLKNLRKLRGCSVGIIDGRHPKVVTGYIFRHTDSMVIA